MGQGRACHARSEVCAGHTTGYMLYQPADTTLWVVGPASHVIKSWGKTQRALCTHLRFSVITSIGSCHGRWKEVIEKEDVATFAELTVVDPTRRPLPSHRARCDFIGHGTVAKLLRLRFCHRLKTLEEKKSCKVTILFIPRKMCHYNNCSTFTANKNTVITH